MREYETGSGTRVLETGTNTGTTPVVVTSGAGGYNNGYGSGGLLETVVLASVLGNRGFGLGGNGTSDVVTSQNTSELRKDVAETSAEVHKLGNEVQNAFTLQTATLASEFRNLDNKICETDKAAIEAKYEAKIQVLESTNNILTKVDDRTLAIKDQLYGLSTTMASEFCDVKHQMEENKNDLALQMERGFNKLEDQRLRDEIARLREERDCNRNNLLFSQQTNSMLNAIDSQLQRQTSQIVQFGTGNTGTSIPTSTNNSVS